MLRHTFSDNYLRGNPDDLRGLAALLGHTNLNTVMIYTESSFDDLAERVERVSLNSIMPIFTTFCEVKIRRYSHNAFCVKLNPGEIVVIF